MEEKQGAEKREQVKERESKEVEKIGNFQRETEIGEKRVAKKKGKDIGIQG